VNRVMGEPAPALVELIKEEGMELAGWVPADETITEYDIKGEPVFHLPEDSPAVVAFERILDTLEIESPVSAA